MPLPFVSLVLINGLLLCDLIDRQLNNSKRYNRIAAKVVLLSKFDLQRFSRRSLILHSFELHRRSLTELSLIRTVGIRGRNSHLSRTNKLIICVRRSSCCGQLGGTFIDRLAFCIDDRLVLCCVSDLTTGSCGRGIGNKIQRFKLCLCECDRINSLQACHRRIHSIHSHCCLKSSTRIGDIVRYLRKILTLVLNSLQCVNLSFCRLISRLDGRSTCIERLQISLSRIDYICRMRRFLHTKSLVVSRLQSGIVRCRNMILILRNVTILFICIKEINCKVTV